MVGVHKKLILILLVNIFLFTGCIKQTDNTEELKNNLIEAQNKINTLEKEIEELKLKLDKDSEKDVMKELTLIQVNDNSINYVIGKAQSDYSQSIQIIGKETEFVEEFETLNINIDDSNEIVRVKVVGEIYDFKIIEIEQDFETGNFIEKEELFKLEMLKDKIVDIKTMLPCGLPHRKIQWKNSENKIYESYLSYDGYGFSGNLIISK